MRHILANASQTGLIVGLAVFSVITVSEPPRTPGDVLSALKVAVLNSAVAGGATGAGMLYGAYRRRRHELAATAALVENPPRPLTQSYPQGDRCLLPHDRPPTAAEIQAAIEHLQALKTQLQQTQDQGGDP